MALHSQQALQSSNTTHGTHNPRHRRICEEEPHRLAIYKAYKGLVCERRVISLQPLP